MKSLFVAVCCLCLLAGCANPNQAVQPAEELLPYEVTLQPCKNWLTGPTVLITNHTGAYATVKKSVYKNSFTNAESTSFYVIIERYRTYYNACNLPEILKKDGQKIKFNGTTRTETDPLYCGTNHFIEFTNIKLIK
jgi:hypothetical protein